MGVTRTIWVTEVGSSTQTNLICYGSFLLRRLCALCILVSAVFSCPKRCSSRRVSFTDLPSLVLPVCRRSQLFHLAYRDANIFHLLLGCVPVAPSPRRGSRQPPPASFGSPN